MNENKYREILTECDVPEHLDRRILLAARIQAGRRKHRRFVLRRLVPAIGVAAAFSVGFGIMFAPAGQKLKAQPHSSELLAMNDWSELDQLNYTLNFELDSGISALTENTLAKGF